MGLAIYCRMMRMVEPANQVPAVCGGTRFRDGRARVVGNPDGNLGTHGLEEAVDAGQSDNPPRRGPMTDPARFRARMARDRPKTVWPKGLRPTAVRCRRCSQWTKARNRLCQKCRAAARTVSTCPCGVTLHGRAKLCGGCRTVAAARRRVAHALAQREYRARHHEQERLREKLTDYQRAAPLEWRASGNAMALFAGKHQTPWSVATARDGEAWGVCCEGRPVAGEVYTDMAAAMDAAGEFYRPRPV